MSAKTIDYLLEELKSTIQVANAQSLRIGATRCVREVIRQIGIEKVCAFKGETLHIRNGYLDLPGDFVQVLDIYSPNTNSDGGRNLGFRVNPSIRTEHRLEYVESGQQLYFPNVTDAEVVLEYYYIVEDADGDIVIPDVIYNAVYKYSEYDLLSKTNNTRHPKWQERRIMKMDADDAINSARANINASNNTSKRTIRHLR